MEFLANILAWNFFDFVESLVTGCPYCGRSKRRCLYPKGEDCKAAIELKGFNAEEEIAKVDGVS